MFISYFCKTNRNQLITAHADEDEVCSLIQRHYKHEVTVLQIKSENQEILFDAYRKIGLTQA